MYEKNVCVKNDVGLHSTVSADFVRRAKKFKSLIWVHKGENSINAKNLLEVLSLGIMDGENIKIIADGMDEEQAVETLIEFLNNTKM